MTLAAITKTLAKELSTSDDVVARVLALIDDGLKAPTIAHFRRAEIGALTEGAIRRIERRRRQLEELERRRASLLRSVSKIAMQIREEEVQAEVAPAGAKADEGTSGEAAGEEAPDDEGASGEVAPGEVAAGEVAAGEVAAGDGGEDSAAEPSTDATTAEPAPDADPYPGVAAGLVAAAERCSERSDLEDLFLPLRRPEPEVQLALDRGLGMLADLLVRPAPRGAATIGEDRGSGDDTEEQASDEEAADQPAAEEPAAEQPAGEQPVAEAQAADEGATDAPTGDEPGAEAAQEPAAPESEVSAAEPEAPAASSAPTPEERGSEPASAPAGEPAETPDATAAEAHAPDAAPASPDAGAAHHAGSHEHHPQPVELNVELARLCAPFVNPDRGVHTDEEALEGAMRILSDRLGRDPKVRGLLRRLVRKQARLVVRPLVDEKQLGRNRSLLKLRTPVRQLQGHKLIALRQAQMRRQVAVSVELDDSVALPRLRTALGKRIPEAHRGVIDAVAERALHRRLLPMIEEDVRAEIRERAEEEAIRSIAQNLRQTLLAPPGGRRPAAGVHVDAKGDWTVAVVDPEGQALGEPVRLEAGAALPRDLAEPLRTALAEHGVRVIAVSTEKGAREGVRKLRETMHMLGAPVPVVPVNDSGLSAWANGEAAREELGELPVPARTAIGLARRWQDPLGELVRVDSRQLGLGAEQGIVGRGALRRLIHETLESSVAFVGLELNTAPVHLLRHVPGLDFEVATRIAERRATQPFASLRELVDEGFLDEGRWRNAAGFLRIDTANDPLDRTLLHPEQYDLARTVAERLGLALDEIVGQREVLRGIKRTGFEIEEEVWRDLVRALSSPRRDPRPRALIPRMLAPDAAPEAIAKDQVVEGVVTSVASFGAFVDLGIAKDGMIHISEVSQRYVRDARGLLSVGQVVRARVTNAEAPRIELSLKGVPDPRRAGGPGRGGDRRGRGDRRDRGEGRGRRDREAWPDFQPNVRAARTRRDGLAGAGGGKPGRGRGPGRGGPGGRRGGGRRGEEEFDRDAVRRFQQAGEVAYNPFARSFQEKQSDKKESGDEA